MQVFIVAGPFPDKHEFSARIPRSENNFVAPLMQAAARAFAQILADAFERIALNAVDGLEQGRCIHNGKRGNFRRSSWREMRKRFWRL